MISIVIPLYNKAHTIVHTLNAVFKQEYQDFEVIIVDDGSTDNGVGIIQQHFHDNRIRIFHQENQGVSVARNRGVEEARCEYVALLDGDDEWHPDYLKIMTNIFKTTPDADCFYVHLSLKVLLALFIVYQKDLRIIKEKLICFIMFLCLGRQAELS